jgi:hypothetical protein
MMSYGGITIADSSSEDNTIGHKCNKIFFYRRGNNKNELHLFRLLTIGTPNFLIWNAENVRYFFSHAL